MSVTPAKTIVYMGMNDAAKGETLAVAGAAKANKRNLCLIKNAAKFGCVDYGGKSYDVATPQGAADFANALPFQTDVEAKRKQAIALLTKTDSTGVDEIASMMIAFANAEAGNIDITHLIISAHGVWDRDYNLSDFTGNGSQVAWSRLKELCDLFPDAAKQVKHLSLSACATGNEPVLAFFRSCFPNLETFKGYARGPTGPGEAKSLATFIALTTSPKPPMPTLASRIGVGLGVAWTNLSKGLVAGAASYQRYSNDTLDSEIAKLMPYFEKVKENAGGADLSHDEKLINLHCLAFTRVGRADLEAQEKKERRDELEALYVAVRRLRLGR